MDKRCYHALDSSISHYLGLRVLFFYGIILSLQQLEPSILADALSLNPCLRVNIFSAIEVGNVKRSIGLMPCSPLVIFLCSEL